MAVDLVLHTVDGPFVAFNLDFQLYFLRLEPIPRLYDENLKPQLIPNLDSWFQAKTHQRYSFQNFVDVVNAFKAGLSKSYSTPDLRSLVAETAVATKVALFERFPDYEKHYWIEALNPVKLESVWVPKIRDEFDSLRAKLGDDLFHNYLCRLVKFAERHKPGLIQVFTRFIKRLGREPIDPAMPVTVDLDVELCKAVDSAVLDRGLPRYKGVPEQVQIRLEILNGRRQAATV